MNSKKITIDGEEHSFFLEHGFGDGGMVVQHQWPGPDGIPHSSRRWFSDPAAAQADLDAMDEAAARAEHAACLKQIEINKANKSEETVRNAALKATKGP